VAEDTMPALLRYLHARKQREAADRWYQQLAAYYQTFHAPQPAGAPAMQADGAPPGAFSFQPPAMQQPQAQQYAFQHAAQQPTPANPYQASVGNPAAFTRAFNAVRNGADTGLAWDALRNSPNAQTEMYLSNAGPSQAFANWLHRNANDDYNRYVADSAQHNDASMQFGDWLGKQNLGAEFLRQGPEARGYFQGLVTPETRWIV
jgi:hypothetical protein